MTGNWKTNQGSAMLEQLPITEKYRMWIDEVRSSYTSITAPHEKLIKIHQIAIKSISFPNLVLAQSTMTV